MTLEALLSAVADDDMDTPIKQCSILLRVAQEIGFVVAYTDALELTYAGTTFLNKCRRRK